MPLSSDTSAKPISLKLEGSLGIATISNPPVNALSKDLRQGLLDVVEACSENPDIKALVLIGDGACFIAGADVKEFGQPPIEPHLPDVIAALEACEKPIVAALNGATLGGGLEVALGCHARIASAKASLGLPEVTLGIVPGAGGTQRLPRAIGMAASLDMVVQGKPIKAQKALDLGLIEAICGDDLLDRAKDLALELANGGDLNERRLSKRDLPADEGIDFDQWRGVAKKRMRGIEAPLCAIDAMEASLNEGFAKGIALERQHFLRLRGGRQAAALRHIFFAEREAGKVADLKDIQPRAIEKVAIIGAGTMGTGIAMAFANAGKSVTLLEISQDALETGLKRIADSYLQTVSRGKMSEDKALSAQNLVVGTTNYQDLSDVDLVVEAAFEKLDIKQTIFRQLDEVCKPDAILATNTSYLDVDEIAAATNRPSSVIGLHFFSPAHIMKLVEVVRTKDSDPVALLSVMKLLKQLRKTGVMTGNGFGFIGNRMYQCYQREAGLMLLKGATPSQVDRALQGYGMAMGPLAVMDMSGIDIGYLMRKSLKPGQYHPDAFQVHDQLVEMDRKGRKTKAGFYSYEEGMGTGKDDPQVISLIEETASRLGYERSAVSDEDIVSACISALAAEGQAILEEGIAQRASDIDVVFINGYGFPRFQGGPMFSAD